MIGHFLVDAAQNNYMPYLLDNALLACALKHIIGLGRLIMYMHDLTSDRPYSHIYLPMADTIQYALAVVRFC